MKSDVRSQWPWGGGGGDAPHHACVDLNCGLMQIAATLRHVGTVSACLCNLIPGNTAVDRRIPRFRLTPWGGGGVSNNNINERLDPKRGLMSFLSNLSYLYHGIAVSQHITLKT